MVCATVKQGMECTFMGKEGCRFNGGSCHTIVEQCEGCQRILDLPTGKFCANFPDPAIKWRFGTCNMATHVKTSKGVKNNKINPLKASKRGR
ncbi:MAG: PxxKW family cysteine-rich protein [Deltaproteobacteria bacterium]|nr:PxxKW family cysteine-rich protein [Deltaproteobacteria bacterium]MBW2018369.1 PxxKW family cysteine-rich protein [Deltaproteobacteria bacterium]MBW2130316.1 PxxKW family cysteine-rich protein [Deltaproteobacteria bacterium]MBW2304859.1 PxxKW family cysteine-rich protein [Deltaproteobacteria bacterium]